MNAVEHCPICGEPASITLTRIEPVSNPDTGRDHGWSREIKTWRHDNGAEHRVPVGAVFQRRARER